MAWTCSSHKYLWYCLFCMLHIQLSQRHSDSHPVYSILLWSWSKKKKPCVWYDMLMTGKCVFFWLYVCVYTCLFLWLLWAGGGWFIPNCAAGRHIIAKWGEEGLMGKGLGRRGWGSEGQRKNVGAVTVHHDNWTNCWRTDLYLKILLGWGTWVQQNNRRHQKNTNNNNKNNKKTGKETQNKTCSSKNI